MPVIGVHKYISLTYIRELSGGEATFMRALIHTFIDEMPDERNALRTAYSDDDEVGFRHCFHKIKTRMAVFANDEIKTYVAKIDELVQLSSLKLNVLTQDLERLILYFELMTSELRAYLLVFPR